MEMKIGDRVVIYNLNGTVYSRELIGTKGKIASIDEDNRLYIITDKTHKFNQATMLHGLTEGQVRLATKLEQTLN